MNIACLEYLTSAASCPVCNLVASLYIKPRPSAVKKLPIKGRQFSRVFYQLNTSYL